jgi:hypothetical protein
MGSPSIVLVKQDSSKFSRLQGACKKCAITLAFGCCSSTAVMAVINRQRIQMQPNPWLQLVSIIASEFVVVLAADRWSLPLFKTAGVFPVTCD